MKIKCSADQILVIKLEFVSFGFCRWPFNRFQTTDMFAHLLIKRYRESYILLNSFNELRKVDIMRGLPRILSLFRNVFYKFNNTKAQMLDSFYYMTLRLLDNVKILTYFTQRYNGRHYVTLRNL